MYNGVEQRERRAKRPYARLRAVLCLTLACDLVYENGRRIKAVGYALYAAMGIVAIIGCGAPACCAML